MERDANVGPNSIERLILWLRHKRKATRFQSEARSSTNNGLARKWKHPATWGKRSSSTWKPGEYAVDDTGLLSARYLHTKRPNAPLYGIRIGFKAAEALGGVLERTT